MALANIERCARGPVAPSPLDQVVHAKAVFEQHLSELIGMVPVDGEAHQGAADVPLPRFELSRRESRRLEGVGVGFDIDVVQFPPRHDWGPARRQAEADAETADRFAVRNEETPVNRGKQIRVA